MNSLNSAVSEYNRAVSVFGNRAGVSVWLQVGEDRIFSDMAKMILAQIADENAETRNNPEIVTQSKTTIAGKYLAATGAYAQ